MRKQERNYAFVDSNNLYLGVKSLGWKIDFVRFREYLRGKYSVETAFLFIGFVRGNEKLYQILKKAGFVCVFKEVAIEPSGHIKGNCDAELVLRAMVELPNYDRAVVVSGDGDFTCLAQHLIRAGKLLRVLAPSRRSCAASLKKLPRECLSFVEDVRERVERRGP